MIKVSIVIPIYNVEKYLKKCIKSVMNQTLKDIEIICVNDGSKDKSKEILEELSIKDKRIKVINKINSGYGHTMNIGMEYAKGEYISIVESDDFIKNDMIETLYIKAKEFKLDFIKSDYYEFVENKSISTEYMKICNEDKYYNRIIDPSKNIESFKFRKYTWTGLYNRKFLEENNIKHNETPGASYQDNGFWFQTFMYAKKIMFLNKAYYMYRQDNPNSSIHSKDKAYAVINEYDFIKEILNLNKEYKNKYTEIYTYFKFINCFWNIYRVDDKYKIELIDKLKTELLTAKENGEFNICLFEDFYKEQFKKIIEDSKKFHSDMLYKKQNIIDTINSYDKVIIYGAGVYGKGVSTKLKSLGLESNIECFAVSETIKDSQYILGIDKKSIETLDKDDKNYLVILSIKKDTKAYEEMLNKLSELGFKNILHSSFLN